jgi:hypothetical protein
LKKLELMLLNLVERGDVVKAINCGLSQRTKSERSAAMSYAASMPRRRLSAG